MDWNAQKAHDVSGDILATLQTTLPELDWGKSGSLSEIGLQPDNGYITFINTNGGDVTVYLPRTTLEDYDDANDQHKAGKDERIAQIIKQVNDSGETGHTIRTMDLPQ